MKVRRSICAMLSLFMMILLLPAEVFSAADPLPFYLCEQSDPFLSAALMDESAEHFNSEKTGITVKNGHGKIVNQMKDMPYSPFEGTGCFAVDAASANEAVQMISPAVTAKSSKISGFAVTVYPLYNSEGATLSLSLSMGNKNYYQSNIKLKPERWQTVFFDFSALSADNRNVKWTISLSDEIKQSYLVDLCGLTSAENALWQLVYFAREFRNEVGQIMSFPLDIILSDNGTTVSADLPALSKLECGMGLCIKVQNYSSCRSFGVAVRTLTGKENVYETQMGEEGSVTTALIPLVNGEIERFSLSFSKGSGTIRILSVTPLPYYEKNESIGFISDCLINRSCDMITIRGGFSEKEAAAYQGRTLYLYGFSAGEDETTLTEKRRPIATSAVDSDTFSFHVPISADFGEVLKRFAVYIECDDRKMAVGASRSVSNPEFLAENVPEISIQGIKGISNTDSLLPTDGVCCTDEVIYADHLLASDLNNSRTVSFGGGFCRIDNDALAALDDRMMRNEKLGLQVYLRIIPDSGQTEAHPLSCKQEYSSKSGFSLDEDKLLSLSVLCRFLAERYGTGHGITDNAVGFVVGDRVNEAALRYAVGAESLSEQVKSYEAAFRSVYQGVRSVSSELMVFLSLGGVWYHAQTSGETAVYDASLFLHCFADYANEKGEMDFGIAYDPYGCQKYSYAVENPDLTDETRYVGFANLEVLNHCLSEKGLQYQGKLRRILLLESDGATVFDNKLLKDLAAEYIYDYLRLSSRSFSSVCGFIPAHPVDYHGSFGAVDTNQFDRYCRFAADLLGNEKFERLYGDSLLSVSPLRQWIVGQMTEQAPNDIIGRADLFTFTEEKTLFQPDIGCHSLKTDVTVGGVSGLAVFHVDADDPGRYRGISATLPGKLNLSDAPYLAATVQPAVLPDGVNEVGVAIEVRSDNHVFFATGQASEGTFTTLYVDLHDFPYADDCQQIFVYLFGLDGEDIGEANLLLERVSILSSRLSDDELLPIIEEGMKESDAQKKPISLFIVLIPAGIGMIALTIEIYRIIRRKRADDIDNEIIK